MSNKQATLRLSSEEDLVAFKILKDEMFAGMTNSQALLKMIDIVRSTQVGTNEDTTKNFNDRLTSLEIKSNAQSAYIKSILNRLKVPEQESEN